MTSIDYTTNGFPGGFTFGATSPVSASLLRLRLAAATVGVAPLGTAVTASFTSRSRLDVRWRTAMVEANLKVSGFRWKKSASYTRLDPSEKSAVSFFLGMAQAALMADEVLSIPFLAHLDAVLVASGHPLPKKKRPDFLGVSLTGRPKISAVVEAKGRSNGYDARAVKIAKDQARELPSLTGFAAPLQVASLAYFDDSGQWQSHLEDPPRTDEGAGQVAGDIVVVEHYRPIVNAIRSSESFSMANVRDAAEFEGEEVFADFPEDGFSLAVPLVVMRVFQDFGVNGFGDIKFDGNFGSSLVEVAASIEQSMRQDGTANAQRAVTGSGISMQPLL